MNILFFGASVTAQSTHHSTGLVTGYVDALMSKFSSHLYSVSRVAYGSSQYSNMGRHGLLNALLRIPSVIFFEWHTTGETHISKDVLEAQHNVLTKLGVRMVVLVLPSKRHTSEDVIDKYKMLEEIEIPCLDLRYLIDRGEGEGLLRDEVHTNEIGAATYASHIDKYIQDNLLDSTNIPTYKSLYDIIELVDPSYHWLLSREIKLDVDLTVGAGLTFSSNKSSQLMFTIMRGPCCPNVRICDLISGNQSELELLDQWSYYDRFSCGIEISIEPSGKVNIAASKTPPNYERHCPRLLESDHKHKIPDSIDELRLPMKSLFAPINSYILIEKSSSVNRSGE